MGSHACLLAVCLLWAYRTLTEGKVSDACHGQSSLQQTHNILQCEEPLEVCITDVKYYQWHPDDGCPREITSMVSPECCQRNDSRCSWSRRLSYHVPDMQRNCSGKSTCDLQPLPPVAIDTPCFDRSISLYSSVRSVIYTCTVKGACYLTRTTTTNEDATEKPESNGLHPYAAIISSSVFSVLLIAIGLTILILVRRSRARQRAAAAAAAASNPNHMPVVFTTNSGKP